MSAYLTAAQATQALGVKRQTLYTYVSRGLIHAAPGPDGRRRRYLAADVEALRLRAAAARGSEPAAATALDWGVPVLASAITSIDVDGPNYRGVPALTLAEEGRPFEAVAELLWRGTLPDTPPPFVADDLGLDLDGLVALIPEGTAPQAVLRAVVSLQALIVGVDDELAQARRLIRRMAASIALSGERRGWRQRLAHALAAPTVAGAVLEGAGAPAGGAADLDRALVLCADHELNASTFAARVAAGTGADLVAAVSAALATLSGPRHGGLSDRVEAVLDGRVDVDPRQPAPGFGHRLYPDGDPRAELLLETAAGRGTRGPGLARLIRTQADRGHPPPNLDVGLVALCSAAGLPPGYAGAVFAVGRCAGWVAHAREQRESGRMLRPRARYVGP